MTTIDYLLICLGEECAEVQQRISKALRFGLDELQVGQLEDNKSRIAYELCDLFTVLQVLRESGLVFVLGESNEKRQKLEKYIAYSKSLGVVSDVEKT